MVNIRFDGVVYPSVQSDSDLCVVIHPKAIGKLKLIKVLQSNIFKTQDEKFETKFIISNEKNCLVEVKNKRLIHFKNEAKEKCWNTLIQKSPGSIISLAGSSRRSFLEEQGRRTLVYTKR